MKSLCCFTSSTTFRTKNNTFGNYQPLSSLIILINFIQLYEKTSRWRFCFWICLFFLLTDPVMFWTSFVMYTSHWKKVCTVQRDRTFMLITFPKSSEPVLRTVSSEIKMGFVNQFMSIAWNEHGYYEAKVPTHRALMENSHLQRSIKTVVVILVLIVVVVVAVVHVFMNVRS